MGLWHMKDKEENNLKFEEKNNKSNEVPWTFYFYLHYINSQISKSISMVMVQTVYHNFTVTQIYEPVWSCVAKQVLIFLGI